MQAGSWPSVSAICASSRSSLAAARRRWTEAIQWQTRLDLQQTIGHNTFCSKTVCLEPLPWFEPLEPFGGIDLVSRVSQAAALDKISRSSFSSQFSRRSSRSSCCSLLDKMSARRASSWSLCRTQFRIAWNEGSDSRASSSGVGRGEPPPSLQEDRCPQVRVNSSLRSQFQLAPCSGLDRLLPRTSVASSGGS